MKNFGKLKNVFNNILAEGVSENDKVKKNIFKSYVKQLKENKILKTQFDVYTRVESLIEENDFKASEKVKRILESINVFNKKDIYKANEKLVKLMGDRDINIEYDNKDLHENISTLIFSSDVDDYVDSLNETIQYTKSNTIKEVVETAGIPNTLFAPMIVDKFNEKYSDLDESTKKAIKTLLEGDNEAKEELFKETVRECLNLINEKLEDAETDLKESLLAAKENLLNRTYDFNKFETDITKVINLKNDLQ